jgi:UDPglucose 6-dehydrogenase
LNKEYIKKQNENHKKFVVLEPDMLADLAVIAQKCPHIQVTVVDLNVERIAAWNDEDLDNIPIYEPGLDKIVGEARGRNFFSTDVEKAIDEAQVIFIS